MRFILSLLAVLIGGCGFSAKHPQTAAALSEVVRDLGRFAAEQLLRAALSDLKSLPDDRRVMLGDALSNIDVVRPEQLEQIVLAWSTPEAPLRNLARESRREAAIAMSAGTHPRATARLVASVVLSAR